jgi:hypothetical protein
MKRFAIALAVTALALCAVSFFVPDVAHAAGIGFDTVAVAGAAKMVLANPALLALRSRHGELTRAAAAKLAEVVDGMPADQVRTIETAHAELARQAGEVATQIADAERAAPTTVIPPAPVTPAILADTVRQAVDQALAGERTRAAEIHTLCGAHGLRDLAADMVTRGLTIDAVRAEVLAKLTEQSRSQPNQRPHITITRDQGDTIRQSVEAAILLRASPTALPANDPGRELARGWRGMSLLEMGRTFLEDTQGVRLRGMSRFELATRLLGLDSLGTRAIGLNSTSDFANVLANVINKRLRNAYEIAPQNWKKIGRQSNNPDFKQKSVVQLSSAPIFKQVAEGAEFSYGGLTDGAEKYALATYGRIIAVTRQTLINDDLGAFDRLPMMLGRQAAELEAKTFWAILTANAAMSDTVALFHANHGNLGSASAVVEAGLTEAKKLMRKQKSLTAKAADAEPLNLTPRYLIVSPDKEIEAAKMLTAVLATQTSTVNVFAGTLELIVEARITGNTWYLSADPALIDTIEYAYLEGEEGLYTEQRIGFEVDGIEIKGRVDFAAKAIDWRGLFMNPGA